MSGLKLTQDDIGRLLLWVAVVARPVRLVEFNPADDSEVLVRPESGGRLWVSVKSLRPLDVPPGSNPDNVAKLIDISADLVLLDKLREKVQELLEVWDSIRDEWPLTGIMNELDELIK